MIELAREEEQEQTYIPIAKIKVVGVGGAGGNAVNRMVGSNYKDVEFFAINTDAQALKMSKAHKKLQIGQKSTKGLGAGANPEVGKRAAEEDLDKVLSELHEADIVFLIGGMGGGTGSGALPVITQALKEKGILTVVVVTKPFEFEGRRRSSVATAAIEKIRLHADTLLVVPNQKLLDVVDDRVSMTEGFDMINEEVLNHSVKGVSDIITKTGHINVDFADVREIMKDQGLAVMGTGRATGDDRAKKAALAAISSPLLENMSIAGAHGVLLNISGSSSLGLHEISAAAQVIYDQVDPDANIILGSVIDDALGEEVSVTVIATGFDEHPVAELKVRGTVRAIETPKQPQQEIAPELQLQKEQLIQKPQQQEAPVKIEAAPAQKWQEQAPVAQKQDYPQEYKQERQVEKVEWQAPQTQQEQPRQWTDEKRECLQPQQAPHNAWKQEERYIQPQQEYKQERQEHQQAQAPADQASQRERKEVATSQDSGLGSNKIQGDWDTPTFMRKQQHDNHHGHYHKKHKKKKNKHHQYQQHQQHRSHEE